MKITTRIQQILAAGMVSAALAASAVAQVPQVKPEDASKHFAAVSKHLELGGLYYSYMDVDGDLAALGKLGDRFLDLARKETKEIPKDLSAVKIIDALGLNSVKAIGMSTRAAGKELYHNRALLYMPDGPKGLMKLFGGKAAPLQIASWAPADTGAALQMDLTLSTLLETIETVLKASGQEALATQFKFAQSLPVPHLNMTVGELVGKLNTRVMVAMRVDETKKLQLPGMPVEMPGLQMMIALDDVDFLMEPLAGMAETNDNVVVEKGEGFTVIRPNSALPGDLDYFKPGLYYDKKAKRIVLTSHLEMAKEAGKGNTLGGSEQYKMAMMGLPAEANGVSFITPQCMKASISFYSQVMKESMKSTNANGAAEEAVKLLMEILSEVPAAPVASVYANVPEGMLFMSNTNSTHKGTMFFSVAAMPLAVMVAMTTATDFRGMPSKRQMSGPAKTKDFLEGRPEAPDNTVKNNLQQIAFSAQTWFIDHPKDKEVTYETLVKNELIFELDPVAGESYKGLTLKRAGGELSVKLKGGAALTHKYQAVTD